MNISNIRNVWCIWNIAESGVKHKKSINQSSLGVLDTTLYDKVCQWLATVRWFSPCTPASSTTKTDHHDVAEILLKVVLNTQNQSINLP